MPLGPRPQVAVPVLQALIAANDPNALAGVVEATYGAPLSDAELGKESLEGRFLRWLAKQR